MKTKYFSILYVFLFAALISTVHAQSNSSLMNRGFGDLFITADTIFRSPYIDIDEIRNTPVPHRYIHGGFKSNDTRFSFYFPVKEKYKGRFFQYITPFPDNENLSQAGKGEEDKIGFSISNGAYFIETNEGGKIDFTKPSSLSDPTIGAYRANAASAQFSRVVAELIYNNGKRPYGYAFGGSGGAYRTVGGIENTNGVWDGVVPYVLGSPVAIPNVFTVRMHAMRILKDKFPQIIDALEPGGSGDMYIGLNQEEKEALMEVTKMGFPPKSWYGYKTMGIHGFLVLYQGIVMSDPQYFKNDFWNVSGYLGAKPTESLLKSRIQKTSKIKLGLSVEQAVSFGLMQPMSLSERGTADAAWKAIGGGEGGIPVGFQLDDIMPEVGFLGGDLIIKTGAAAGKILQLTKVVGDKVILGPADASVLVNIKPGDEVQVDNSNFLAIQTYHRHQVPAKEYKVWDQFRDTLGNPIYPQRAMLLGPRFTKGAAGVLPIGKFKGKMILLESLWDREAFPWQADWYRQRVKQNLGDKTDENFRLWYTDHALHGDVNIEDDPTHTVSYLGVLQQALLDLSDWVEKGVSPAPTTNYKIVDGQVIIPQTANERSGIQPVVVALVKGGKKIEVKAGTTVTLTAIIEIPKGTGKIVEAAWNFEGLSKDFSRSSDLKTEVFSDNVKLNQSGKNCSKTVVKTTHTFTHPGTYFPTIRVISQREGDKTTLFTRIQNLDRVRVIVK